MKISVILAHPDPKNFNHAIAQTAVQTLQENGHQVAFHDHCAEVAVAEGIVIVHPNW